MNKKVQLISNETLPWSTRLAAEVWPGLTSILWWQTLHRYCCVTTFTITSSFFQHLPLVATVIAVEQMPQSLLTVA